MRLNDYISHNATCLFCVCLCEWIALSVWRWRFQFSLELCLMAGGVYTEKREAERSKRTNYREKGHMIFLNTENWKLALIWRIWKRVYRNKYKKNIDRVAKRKRQLVSGTREREIKNRNRHERCAPRKWGDAVIRYLQNTAFSRRQIHSL